MSLEHSPARQQRGLGDNGGPPLEPADDLLIGAEAIAHYVYGNADAKQIRDIYRNVFDFSFFKHGNSIAALKSTIRAEIVEAQRVAREERRQKKASEERPVAKPRRPIRWSPRVATSVMPEPAAINREKT